MFEQNPLLGPGMGSLSSHSFEILIMLLGAFILGFLLRHLLARFIGCKHHQVEIERLTQALNQKNTVPSRSAFVEVKAPPRDNLKMVEGIGPKVEQILNSGGIMNFTQLANTKPEQIKALLLAAGDHFRQHDPGTWPAQALLAAQGKWDELKKWQDQLDGGRVVSK